MGTQPVVDSAILTNSLRHLKNCADLYAQARRLRSFKVANFGAN